MGEINGKGYEKTLRFMYDTPFEIFIQSDNNRIDECTNKRHQLGYSVDKSIGNCFEILVLLANHMNNLLDDVNSNDRTEPFFWNIMANLNLDYYNDDHFDEGKVYNILNEFMHKRYLAFPVNRPKRMLRKADLWTFVNWYVNDNYMYEFKDLEE